MFWSRLGFEKVEEVTIVGDCFSGLTGCIYYIWRFLVSGRL